MIPAFVTQLAIVDGDLAKQLGPLSLFAVVLREGLANLSSTSSSQDTRWDLLISARSTAGDPASAVNAVVRTVRRRLGPSFLVDFASVVPLDPRAPVVRAIQRAAGKVLREPREISAPSIARIVPDVVTAYVITSQPDA